MKYSGSQKLGELGAELQQYEEKIIPGNCVKKSTIEDLKIMLRSTPKSVSL